MEIFLGIVFMLFGICNWIMVYIECGSYEDNLKNKIKTWSYTICAGICFGVALNYFMSHNTKKEYQPKEYPASEYRLSIKTTTIDDKTDTTYVITKIK